MAEKEQHRDGYTDNITNLKRIGSPEQKKGTHKDASQRRLPEKSGRKRGKLI